MTVALKNDFDPRYGEAVELAPGVRRITANNPGPFTFRGTNSFLIGDDALIVLDPGPADPAHLGALLTEARGRPVAAILISHSHRDHYEGARDLQQRTGAPILAGALQSGAGAPEGEEPDTATERRFRPDDVVPDGGAIEVPGYRLEAIATPGHAPDHLAFALAGSGILFSGDHVMGWSTTVVAPPGGSMGQYMASLDRLLERAEDIYLPAHGDRIDAALAHVRGLKTHRMLRERAILDRLRAGDRTIAEILPRLYAGLDPRLESAASLSMLAHLQHLVGRGEVRADGVPELTSRFEPT